MIKLNCVFGGYSFKGLKTSGSCEKRAMPNLPIMLLTRSVFQGHLILERELDEQKKYKFFITVNYYTLGHAGTAG